MQRVRSYAGPASRRTGRAPLGQLPVDRGRSGRKRLDEPGDAKEKHVGP